TAKPAAAGALLAGAAGAGRFPSRLPRGRADGGLPAGRRRGIRPRLRLLRRPATPDNLLMKNRRSIALTLLAGDSLCLFFFMNVVGMLRGIIEPTDPLFWPLVGP